MQVENLKEIATWVSAGERNGVPPEVMMQQLCERLVDAGVALWRVGVFVRTLHPQMFGQSFTWRRGKDVTVYAAPYGIEESEDFLNSPLRMVTRWERKSGGANPKFTPIPCRAFSSMRAPSA